MTDALALRISVDTLLHQPSPVIVKHIHRRIHAQQRVYPIKRAGVDLPLDCLAGYAKGVYCQTQAMCQAAEEVNTRGRVKASMLTKP